MDRDIQLKNALKSDNVIATTVLVPSTPVSAKRVHSAEYAPVCGNPEFRNVTRVPDAQEFTGMIN